MRQRFKQINAFEDLIQESDTAILKFFRHISKEEQKERLGWASQKRSNRDAVPHFFFSWAMGCGDDLALAWG